MAVDDQAIGGGFLANLSPNMRIAVIVGGAVLFVAVIFFAFFGGGSAEEDDGFRTVYRNLPLADVGNAKDYLENEFRIPVKLGENGTSIRVPKNQVEEAAVKLAQKNMPGSGVVGFEIFDKQSFISTDFEKKVALQRAMNGNLSRLIGRFQGIELARVNIVVPEPALFSEEQLPTTASVLLEFSGGGGFKPEYVQAITHMVASSIPGLKPGNVTVVDTTGNILHEGQEGLYGEDSTKKMQKQAREELRIQSLMEQRLENKVIRMLDKILGPGKAKAVVTAKVGFDRTQIRRRDNQPVMIKDANGTLVPAQVASRSVTEKTESTGAVKGGSSVGIDANNPNQEASTTTVSGTGEKSLNDRKNTQSSFVYDKVEKLTSKQGWFLENKSISVSYEKPVLTEEEIAAAEEGQGVAPLTAPEIEKMVRNAINFDEQAGDSIFVKEVKFDTSKMDILKKQMDLAKEGTAWWWYALFALGGLVVGAGIGGALLGKKKAAAGAEQFGVPGAPQYSAIPGAMPGMPGAPGAIPGMPGALPPGAPGALPPGAPGAMAPGAPMQQAQEVTRAPVMPPTPDNPFGFLQGVTPQTVAQLLSTERLPTLVAVLAQLDPSQAEDVINLLNPEIQNEVRTRLAKNPVLPPMTQKMVSQSLKKRLAAMSANVT